MPPPSWQAGELPRVIRIGERLQIVTESVDTHSVRGLFARDGSRADDFGGAGGLGDSIKTTENFAMRWMLVTLLMLTLFVEKTLAQYAHPAGSRAAATRSYHEHSHGPSCSSCDSDGCFHADSFCRAEEFCEPVECDVHEDCGGWSISGGILYLKPMIDDSFFVVNSPVSTTFPNGVRENNDFRFQPGFRLGIAYSSPETGREFQLRYSRLDTDESQFVGGDFLWATLGRADFTSVFENYTGTASSRLDLVYQRTDALISQSIPLSSAEAFVQLGVEHASVRLDEGYTYDSGVNLGTIDQRSRMWGIGPQFGFGCAGTVAEFDSGVLSVNFLGSASLLVGRTSTYTNNILNAATLVNLADEDASRMIPALHATCGVDYATTVLDLPLRVTFAYEFNSYVRAISRLTFPDDVADGLAVGQFYNFDAHGLYAGATLEF